MSVVDIITPTIPERKALFLEAQASVAKQTFHDIGHLAMLDREQFGPACMRNVMVQQSLAEWLVFLDDDDLLDPEFVQCHLDAALLHSADVVYSLCRYPPHAERRPPITDFDPVRLSRGNYIPMTTLVRRSAFNKTSGFKSGVRFEDHQLWLDLMHVGAKFVHIPKVLWTYRLHGNPWKPE
jgi:glycosyltransferase involved in cell wall biosynthesis